MEQMPGLKRILKWSLQQVAKDPQNDDGSASRAKPMSAEDQQWLQEAMSAMVVDETKRMNDIVTILKHAGTVTKEQQAQMLAGKKEREEKEKEGGEAAAEETLEELLATVTAEELDLLQQQSLEELVERVEQIDNAKYFALKQGGSGELPLLMRLVQDARPSVRAAAAEVFATVVQNNSDTQRRAMELKFLPLLMQRIASDGEDDKVKVKALLALSSLVRSEKPGSTVVPFLRGGGLLLLCGALQQSRNARLRSKALFLLQYIFFTVPRSKRDLAGTDGALAKILALATEDTSAATGVPFHHTFFDASDKALNLLAALSEDPECLARLQSPAAAGLDAAAALEGLVERLAAVPGEEAEYVEDGLRQARQILQQVRCRTDVTLNGTQIRNNNAADASEYGDLATWAGDSTETKDAAAAARATTVAAGDTAAGGTDGTPMAITDGASADPVRAAVQQAVKGCIEKGGGSYSVSVPTAAAATMGQTYGKQIEKWRNKHITGWEAQKAHGSGPLLKKFPTRAALDAWMMKQCQKALDKKAAERQQCGAAQ